jgi:hypothetical protein
MALVEGEEDLREEDEWMIVVVVAAVVLGFVLVGDTDCFGFDATGLADGDDRYLIRDED